MKPAFTTIDNNQHALKTDRNSSTISQPWDSVWIMDMFFVFYKFSREKFSDAENLAKV